MESDKVIFIKDVPSYTCLHALDLSGITCVKMACEYYSKTTDGKCLPDSCFQGESQANQQTPSILDLANLSISRGLSVTLYQNIGNLSYLNQSGSDSTSITGFSNGCSTRIKKRLPTFEEVREHLHEGNLVLMAFDNRLICCIDSDCEDGSSLFSYCIKRSRRQKKGQKNYVLLIGYDKFDDTILFRNPYCEDDLCSMRSDNVKLASKSFPQSIFFNKNT